MADLLSKGKTMVDWLYSAYMEGRRAITWSSVAVCGLVVIPTWLVYVQIVKPLCSPLRKVPGLPWNPLTGNTKRLLKGEAMEAYLDLIKEFKTTIIRYYFYFGAERLLVADPEALKYMLTKNSRNYIKPKNRIVILRLALGDGLVTSEGATHSVHKKLMSPAFNQAAVNRMVYVFAEYARRLTDIWEGHILAVQGNKDGVNLPVHADLTRLTLDIIGKCAFGYDFKSLEEGTQKVSLAFQRLLSGQDLGFKMAIPGYFYLPTPTSLRIRSDINIMNGVIYDIIKSKRESLKLNINTQSVAGDLLGMMMMARDEVTGEGMDNKELRDQAMTIMLAGHETTAVAMSWCLLALAQHPEIQERARDEAFKVFPKHSAVMPERFDQLEYIPNVIKETLRLYPPLPNLFRQNVEDDYLGSYFIPGGTVMVLGIGAMMRLPEYFSDPEEFKPERFDTEEAQNLYTFLPFLIGPRMCLGYKFALQEMKVVITTLLRKFKFAQIPGTSYARKQVLTMRPQPALQLRVSLV